MARGFSWFHYLLFQLLDTSVGPLEKAASWREGCHPPSQTLPDPLIGFIKHRYDQKSACRNLDRGMSSLATQPTDTEKGRPAPYKLKNSKWNIILKTSPRSLGLFPTAAIAQALPARCKSQSPLRTAPMGSYLQRYKDLEGLGIFFLSSIHLTRCPKTPPPWEHHGRSNESYRFFKVLIWRTPSPGFFSPFSTETQVWM